jgi:hypothetical protein
VLGLEFVKQVAELVVMETLLDRVGYVATESAGASPGADRRNELPGQGDTDFLNLAVQAGPGVTSRLGRSGGQDGDNSL